MERSRDPRSLTWKNCFTEIDELEKLNLFKNCVIWEFSALVSTVHARIHDVNWRFGYRNGRGSPGTCNASVSGQRRLPIVSGTFRVKRRSFALDICWERKRVRAICSHLHPRSGMHMYAGDLEDLRLLVTFRAIHAHVRICVDAQNGLGTSASRPGSRNIGTAFQLHIVLKIKDYSSDSSWNTC